MPAPGAGAVTKPPGNLYFPSASSIPPVNIMTAEPAAAPPHDTTGTAETARKGAPAATQARPPATSGTAPARPAPTPLSPPQQ
jgi:hypothetical protein